MSLLKELLFKFYSYRFRKSKKKNIYLDFSEKKIEDLYKTIISQNKKTLSYLFYSLKFFPRDKGAIRIRRESLTASWRCFIASR